MQIRSLLLSLIFVFCNVTYAESKGAVTGICKDGTEYTGASKRGACRGHKGIKEWYGDKGAVAAEGSGEKSAKQEAKAKKAEKSESATAEAAGPATGLCNDGTEYTGASKRGACRGHKGLKEWYADKDASTSEDAGDKSMKKKAKAEKEESAPAATTGAATALCKDGSEWTGESKRGACRGHKGIKEWYADKEDKAKASSDAKSEKEEPAPVKEESAPAAASGAATGLCKDGTEWTGESKRGACRGQKGIKEWYADKDDSAKTKPAAKAEKEESPVEESEDEAVPEKSSKPAAGGGKGKVWVNTNSKIYHCEDSRFYGKTKAGEYMTEAEAQEKGYTANRKKVCATAQ